MPTTRERTRHLDRQRVDKGQSLARGPAWVVGLVLAVFGLLLFFEVGGTPLSTSGFPDGQATSERFIGFGVNAWSAWLTTAAGVIVLAGAAQHAIAKLLSLLVGLALGAASLIALVDGNDVLGLAAANGLTALGWGIAAAVLIVTALLPRVGGRRHDDVVADDRTVADPTAADAAGERERQQGLRVHDDETARERERDRIAAERNDAAVERPRDGFEQPVARPADEEPTRVHDHATPISSTTADPDNSEDRTEIRGGQVVRGGTTGTTEGPQVVEYPARERR